MTNDEWVALKRGKEMADKEHIQALEARLERAEGLLTMAVEHWTTSDKVMGFLQRNKWCEEAQAFLSEAQK